MLKHLGQNSVGCSFQVHWLECWKSRWETFADVRLQLECSIFFRIQLVARLSKLTTYIDSWPPDSTDCCDVNIHLYKRHIRAICYKVTDSPLQWRPPEHCHPSLTPDHCLICTCPMWNTNMCIVNICIWFCMQMQMNWQKAHIQTCAMCMYEYLHKSACMCKIIYEHASAYMWLCMCNCACMHLQMFFVVAAKMDLPWKQLG